MFKFSSLVAGLGSVGYVLAATLGVAPAAQATTCYPVTGHDAGGDYYGPNGHYQAPECQFPPVVQPLTPTPPVVQPISNTNSNTNTANGGAGGQGGAGGSANQEQNQQQSATAVSASNSKANATGGSANALGGSVGPQNLSNAVTGGNVSSVYNEARQYRSPITFLQAPKCGAALGVVGGIDNDGYQVGLGFATHLGATDPTCDVKNLIDIAKAGAPTTVINNNIPAPAASVVTPTTVISAPTVSAPPIPFKAITKRDKG
jgi:hypothetical protein